MPSKKDATVAELRELLAGIGLNTTGNRVSLLRRLYSVVHDMRDQAQTRNASAERRDNESSPVAAVDIGRTDAHANSTQYFDSNATDLDSSDTSTSHRQPEPMAATQNAQNKMAEVENFTAEHDGLSTHRQHGTKAATTQCFSFDSPTMQQMQTQMTPTMFHHAVTEQPSLQQVPHQPVYQRQVYQVQYQPNQQHIHQATVYQQHAMLFHQQPVQAAPLPPNIGARNLPPNPQVQHVPKQPMNANVPYTPVNSNASFSRMYRIRSVLMCKIHQ